MDRFTSPVFLSVNERGELQEGLGGVPDHKEGRSILFVGNHQLLGIDMPILVRQAHRFKIVGATFVTDMERYIVCSRHSGDRSNFLFVCIQLFELDTCA